MFFTKQTGSKLSMKNISQALPQHVVATQRVFNEPSVFSLVFKKLANSSGVETVFHGISEYHFCSISEMLWQHSLKFWGEKEQFLFSVRELQCFHGDACGLLDESA